jgi:hypothetical protein
VSGVGFAEWSGTEWELDEGAFTSVAAMEAFAEPIKTAALAYVEETAEANENAVTYVYEAGWARSAALSSGYAFALSSITDVSAVGLRVGDYGLLNGQVYRLASDVAAVGGATVLAWVRPEAYAATRTLQGWYTGSEADAAAVYAQGCIRGVGNTGTSSTTGGYLRLATSGSQTETVGFLLGAVVPGTKVYLRFEVRLTPGTSYNGYPCVIADGANAVFVAQNNITSGTGGLLSFVGNTSLPIGTAAQYRGSRTALPTTTPDLFEVLDDGALVTIWRNGLVYASYQRTAMLVGTDRIYWGFSGASGTGHIETRNCVGYTWT